MLWRSVLSPVVGFVLCRDLSDGQICRLPQPRGVHGIEEYTLNSWFVNTALISASGWMGNVLLVIVPYEEVHLRDGNRQINSSKKQDAHTPYLLSRTLQTCPDPILCAPRWTGISDPLSVRGSRTVLTNLLSYYIFQYSKMEAETEKQCSILRSHIASATCPHHLWRLSKLICIIRIRFL